MGIPKRRFQLNLNRNTSSFVATEPEISGAVDDLIAGLQQGIQFQDEGNNLETKGEVETLNFVGSGVVATSPGSDTITVTIAGAGSIPYITKTANYTLTNADGTIDCTTNSFTITLLSAVGISGQIFNVKNSGNGTISIATTSGETIDGHASGVITLNQFDNLQVQSTGSSWIIL